MQPHVPPLRWSYLSLVLSALVVALLSAGCSADDGATSSIIDVDDAEQSRQGQQGQQIFQDTSGGASVDTYVPPMDSGSSRAVDAGRATPDVPSTVDAGAPQNKDDVATGPWSCEFTNPFSKADECRDYSGTWMKSDIEADCGAIFTGVSGKLFNSACDTSGAFGYCAVEAIGGAKILNYYYAGDQAMTAQVCTSQLKGLWFPLTNDDNDAGNTSESDAGNTNESDAASDKGADDAGGTDNGNTDAGNTGESDAGAGNTGESDAGGTGPVTPAGASKCSDAEVAKAPQATDPGQTGPVKVVKTNASMQLPGGGFLPTSVSMDIYTPTGNGPFPLVVMLHGFQLSPKDYASYGAHLASWGYVAIVPQLAAGNFLQTKTHLEQAEQVKLLLDWAQNQNSPTGALQGKADISAVMLAGHSLGGKLAFMTAAMDNRVKVLAAIDPVDGAPGPGASVSVNNPSVTPEQMPKITVPMLLVGETSNAQSMNPILPACAPAAENFQQFFKHASSPALEVTITGASHMSFLDNPSCGLACLACPAGSDDPIKTRMRAQRLMVAFGEVYLKDSCGFKSWLTGADAKADSQSGAISFTSKNGF